MEPLGFIIGAAQSLDGAIEQLQDKGAGQPRLIVLDLYLPDAIPTEKAVRKLRAAAADLQRSASRLHAVMAELGQSSTQTFRYLKRIRAKSRHFPVVVFSRKGTLDVARECFSAGASDVLGKPQPSRCEPASPETVEREFDEAMTRAAPGIARSLEDALANSTWWARYRSHVGTFFLGVLASLIAWGLSELFSWVG